MCLAIPGRVEALLSDEPLARLGRVSFGGIEREVNLSFTPEANVGSFVLTHVGFAIACIDENEAMRVFDTLGDALPTTSNGDGNANGSESP
ncbi:MAG: HypC/HybG/HupF family hydrogenase formation chaperone [Halieaceae bacterium]|jgi:hydrogenase expression/formation protein HypC|nr:HypC/HybG/HupF family hydrogenase formation chaperone [Halieaceae bacterium]